MAASTDTWLDLADAPSIDGLRFRRPRRNAAEYEALAELIGVASRADDIPWFPSGAMLREEWEDDPEVFGRVLTASWPRSTGAWSPSRGRIGRCGRDDPFTRPGAM